MTANANVVDLVKGNSTLVRPKFSPGLLLRDDDLTVGVDYTRELSRLLFQSLFGCGVVCGLKVTPSTQCGKLLVTIASGVALNGLGDPIYVPSDTTVTVDPTCGQELPPKIWVILCRTEKCCSPRSTVCGCDDSDSAAVCTREQDGFEIRLVKVLPDQCSCSCDELLIPDPPQPKVLLHNTQMKSKCWCADPCGCQKDHYAGKCACDCCDADCVVLAVLCDPSRDSDYSGTQLATTAATAANPWIANHSVRRFVRPVLMRDPIVYEEQTYDPDPCTTLQHAPTPPAQQQAPMLQKVQKPTRSAKAAPSRGKAAASAAAVKTAPKVKK